MDDIGWKCLWFGMLPYTWELEQEKYYRQQQKEKKTHTGRTWTAHLIKYTWEQLQKRWKQRNRTLYPPGKSAEREFIACKIKALYSARDKIDPYYHRYLEPEIEELLHKDTDIQTLRAFVVNRTQIIQKAIKEHERNQRNKQAPITDYFQRIEKPTKKRNTQENTAADPTRQDNSPPAPD